MAQVIVTKLIDGARNAVFHVFVEGDGTGEVSDEVIADPVTSFDPALPPNPTLTVKALHYDINGFAAKLEFDYLVSDTPVWSMSSDSSGSYDFCAFGGLKDRSDATDGKGKLKLTTVGLGAGDFGTLIVELRKD